MYEGIYGIYAIVALLLLAAWVIAGYLVGRLAFRRTRGGLRLSAWITLVIVGLAGLLVAANALTVWWLWSSTGWWFAQDLVILALPLTVLPAAATLIVSPPRLWRLARGAATDRRAKVDASTRGSASAPGFVVPVQAAAVGAVLGAYAAFFRHGPPLLDTAVVLWALLIATTATLWVRQLRHCRAMSKPEATVASKLGVRAVRAAAVVLVFSVGFGVWFTWSAQASALPDRFSMLAHENVDYGGGPEVGHGTVTGHSHGGHDGSGDGQAVSVTELTGPREGEPDRRFTLTAQEAQVKLASGKTVDAWTFDGQAPGPELRVRQGDLVEVTLVNEDVENGLTIHWHGLDVPNAEDGVAGVTQDAVRPRETHTYRFRAEQVGTYWYHSHQVSSKQVKKGLFGALVVLPEDYDESEVEDITVAAHRWPGEQEFATIATTFGTSDTLDRRFVSPGTKVRLRLINTDSYPMRFTLSGTPFQVAAIDGTDINGPTDITGQTLPVAAGGRYDITFTMPETPVALGLDNRSGPDILFSRDGSGEVPAAEPGPEFDPTTYGTPEPTPFSPSSTFDREFVQVFDSIPGFYDGQFTHLWATNGEVFPDTPTLMVREGDLVKVTFVNRSFMDHPMHPHGHHMLVLSRNGRPVTGSPWWTDTLNVAPGETYEVVFKADNPGIWMDHCHNLDHAAAGMMMHLGYEGVTTPFEVGDATGNHPE